MVQSLFQPAMEIVRPCPRCGDVFKGGGTEYIRLLSIVFFFNFRAFRLPWLRADTTYHIEVISGYTILVLGITLLEYVAGEGCHDVLQDGPVMLRASNDRSSTILWRAAINGDSPFVRFSRA